MAAPKGSSQITPSRAAPAGCTADTVDVAGGASYVSPMPRRSVRRSSRHRGFLIVTAVILAVGFAAYQLSPTWAGWESIYQLVSKGDNLPIAGLIPLVIFFTYLALSEALRHDRLSRQGQEDKILDEMYR